MPNVKAQGKTFVTTEIDEALQTREQIGRLIAPNGTVLNIRRAFDNIAAATTDDAYITANASAAIRIVSLVIHAGGTATSVTFKSKAGVAASVAISHTFALAANQSVVLPFNPQGWFQTSDVNQALVITTGAGSTTGITAQFIEIPADCFNLL